MEFNNLKGESAVTLQTMLQKFIFFKKIKYLVLVTFP